MSTEHIDGQLLIPFEEFRPTTSRILTTLEGTKTLTHEAKAVIHARGPEYARQLARTAILCFGAKQQLSLNEVTKILGVKQCQVLELHEQGLFPNPVDESGVPQLPEGLNLLPQTNPNLLWSQEDVLFYAISQPS